MSEAAKRGASIPAQLRDGRAAAEAEGREVVAPAYSDEAVSAYSCNRGPDLERAMAHAERLVAERGA